MPLGIPHSVFLSWSEGDQDKALGWVHEQRLHCDGCHTRREEWDESVGGNRFAYVAMHETCPGCEVLAMEEDNVPEKARGVRLFLVTQAEAERMMEDVGIHGVS